MEANVAHEDRIGQYKFVRTLLQGQNSTVMEVVQDGTGKRFAMKQMLPSKAEDAAERNSSSLRPSSARNSATRI